MHLDRLWIMVDRDIYTVSGRLFDAGACPAATSKIVYYQLSVNHHWFPFSSHDTGMNIFSPLSRSFT